MAHGANQRLREIGIRFALGARPNEVLWLILADGLAMTLAGVILGSAAAYWVTGTRRCCSG